MFIPVVIGAIALGGAFDFFQLQPNRMYQIFDYNAVKENKEVIANPITEVQYQVVESDREALAMLNIPSVMSLKAKNGDVQLQGVGNYISYFINRRHTVEILILHRNVKTLETFPSFVKQGKGWQKKPQRIVGTHFIKAIEYGGQLGVSVQFKSWHEDVEEVRRTVVARLAKSGSPDLDFFDRLEELTSLLADKTNLTLVTFSNVMGFSPPTQLSDLKKLFEEFAEMVDGGKVAPLRIDLADIHNVQENFTEFIESRETLNYLPELEEMYDDLRVAMSEFRYWDGQGGILTPDQQKKVDEFQVHLKRAYRAMKRAIHDLDITQGTSQFDEAVKAYNYDGETKFNRYMKELLRLIKSIDGNSLFRTIYSRLLAIQGESRVY